MSKLATSIVVIGFIVAAAGTAAAAFFNDTVTSEDNVFRAGTIDLEIGYISWHNNQVVDQQDYTDSPGAIFDFQDIKAADVGITVTSLRVSDNDAWIWMLFNQTDGTGNLAENIEVDIWYDEDSDGVRDQGEEYIYQGTLAGVEDSELGDGLLLDGNTTTEDEEAFEAEEDHYISFRWELPESTDDVQGQLKQFDLEFYAEQERNNPDPENPWQ